ncbi:MAG: pyrroloquinoline quinone precursor peptide PqqA [Zoogloea sp.]|jgi:coenzyme PQQ precursor peptide PqqA|nr:pyrroloquinoline quinone precursor peptide PqqA [Zoogloea sp.]
MIFVRREYAALCHTVRHGTANRQAGNHQPIIWRSTMTWTTPQACDLRFGFEITMYIAAK